jgi:hypothetical protein
MVVGSFVAGVMGRLVLNPFLYRFGMLKMWAPGMGYIETTLSNQFDFWLSLSIGTALAIAVLGFYSAISKVIQASRTRTATSGHWMAPPKGRGDIPIAIALLAYFAKTAVLILVCHWLVPKFPVWILAVFGFVYTPLMSYISARLTGLTGNTVGIPYAREAAFVLSGHVGVDIWFAPVPMGDMGGGAQHFREIELTGTKFTSIFKAQFFMLPLAVVTSLFFWSFLYRISDIPEEYPYAMQFWPRDAALSAFWMTATTTGNAFFLRALKWPIIGAGTAYGLIAYSILRVLGAPTLFLYGTIQGLVDDPAWLLPRFVAALVGRFYMEKVFGRERWTQFTPVLAAGFGCGVGLVSMASVAVTLISNAVSSVPF